MTEPSLVEEQTCWEKWNTSRDREAGDELLRAYLPLVNYHVQRISVGLPKSVNKDELRSLGMLGLYDALKKFEPERDLKFDTYASFRIRGAILDGLRREDWLPRSLREKTKKVEAAIEKLEQENLRSVSAKEVAEELSLSENDVTTVMSESFMANILSIDEENKESESREKVSYTIEDKKAITPENRLLQEELHGELALVIKELSEKEQLVVSLFYYEELTLTEIGQILGLSTSRISQIHSKALFRIRQVLQRYM
ncbi:FliA/WhiG family RNA polymerase sigma factor [Fictibacillus phosphorivorans]|uniref:FliA/WhiG family RNA polymerase sigma factor n=1 Tax=Fictibacillus phosphorivorans TaxID=1221500 RepID=UPI00203D3DF9|nr:FliA/WhiG family RNA polymerase sigma factor [Fictibacillus phosphorivorans]MCM3717134.1 FliA/WhiG family RNA polymerase sigma factor [Fictibacillus phosphorivorans]MCM3774821.1 FliA/WhiG family RNA polymerase sigma factor [Fictibacillus phosphorivorans]